VRVVGVVRQVWRLQDVAPSRFDRELFYPSRGSAGKLSKIRGKRKRDGPTPVPPVAASIRRRLDLVVLFVLVVIIVVIIIVVEIVVVEVVEVVVKVVQILVIVEVVEVVEVVVEVIVLVVVLVVLVVFQFLVLLVGGEERFRREESNRPRRQFLDRGESRQGQQSVTGHAGIL
jgi:hypothetical protein